MHFPYDTTLFMTLDLLTDDHFNQFYGTHSVTFEASSMPLNSTTALPMAGINYTRKLAIA